jgi:hypothetical protein
MKAKGTTTHRVLLINCKTGTGIKPADGSTFSLTQDILKTVLYLTVAMRMFAKNTALTMLIEPCKMVTILFRPVKDGMIPGFLED